MSKTLTKFNRPSHINICNRTVKIIKSSLSDLRRDVLEVVLAPHSSNDKAFVIYTGGPENRLGLHDTAFIKIDEIKCYLNFSYLNNIQGSPILIVNDGSSIGASFLYKDVPYTSFEVVYESPN